MTGISFLFGVCCIMNHSIQVGILRIEHQNFRHRFMLLPESIATAISCQLASEEGWRFSKSTEAPVKTLQKDIAMKEQTTGKAKR